MNVIIQRVWCYYSCTLKNYEMRWNVHCPRNGCHFLKSKVLRSALTLTKKNWKLNKWRAVTWIKPEQHRFQVFSRSYWGVKIPTHSKVFWRISPFQWFYVLTPNLDQWFSFRNEKTGKLKTNTWNETNLTIFDMIFHISITATNERILSFFILPFISHTTNWKKRKLRQILMSKPKITDLRNYTMRT